MKKHLISEGGRFYKANLHCHSTFSDGAYTPEEIKKLYMQQGYSVVAYTDHEIFIPHSDELTDENFVALNGCEMSVSEQGKSGLTKKCCHLCMIAMDENNKIQPCWHRTRYLWGNAANYRDAVCFDDTKPDFEREHTAECINRFIKEFSDNGFFVTYNHPTWSLEDLNDYGNFSGMNAMEICNSTCLIDGYNDYNDKEYDGMLRAGKRIYCIAADDSHGNLKGFFGAFTMIKAEELTYSSIIKALQKGDFYASQGPLIEELWMEDGYMHVTCSEAQRVIFSTAVRKVGVTDSTEGNPVTSASFKVEPEYGYVRVTVIDKNGKRANTSAYFTDEIL